MGSGEAGAQFIANSPYWDDIGVNGGTSAGGNYSYVVEWNSNPIPAPGAVALLGAAGLVGSRRRRA
jgi:MYXO-CTERM domain-containing protein